MATTIDYLNLFDNYIAKDCGNIIIQYILFDIKYKESVKICDIRKSEYFNILPELIKNNFFEFEEKKSNLENLVLDEDKLYLFYPDEIKLYDKEYCLCLKKLNNKTTVHKDIFYTNILYHKY